MTQTRPEPTGTVKTALQHATRLLRVNPALAEQQARDRVLGGGGADPRVAELQARIDAAKRALG